MLFRRLATLALVGVVAACAGGAPQVSPVFPERPSPSPPRRDSTVLPDPRLTPGAVLPVTAAEICVRGYAGHVRAVPGAVRLRVYRAYGMARPRTGLCATEHGCELDHLISLELGGSNEPANLWPEPYDGPWNAHLKDALENRLHALVCAGRMALGEAQRIIASNWIAGYRSLIGEPR